MCFKFWKVWNWLPRSAHRNISGVVSGFKKNVIIFTHAYWKCENSVLNSDAIAFTYVFDKHKATKEDIAVKLFMRAARMKIYNKYYAFGYFKISD